MRRVFETDYEEAKELLRELASEQRDETATTTSFTPYMSSGLAFGRFNETPAYDEISQGIGTYVAKMGDQLSIRELRVMLLGAVNERVAALVLGGGLNQTVLSPGRSIRFLQTLYSGSAVRESGPGLYSLEDSNGAPLPSPDGIVTAFQDGDEEVTGIMEATTRGKMDYFRKKARGTQRLIREHGEVFSEVSCMFVAVPSDIYEKYSGMTSLEYDGTITPISFTRLPYDRNTFKKKVPSLLKPPLANFGLSIELPPVVSYREMYNPTLSN